MLLQIALELEKVALNDEYFIKRKLYPNVDFFSGELHQTCVTVSVSQPRSAQAFIFMSDIVAYWTLRSCLQAAPGHAYCSWPLLRTVHTAVSTATAGGLAPDEASGLPFGCRRTALANTLGMRMSGVHWLAWLAQGCLMHVSPTVLHLLHTPTLHLTHLL